MSATSQSWNQRDTRPMRIQLGISPHSSEEQLKSLELSVRFVRARNQKSYLTNFWSVLTHVSPVRMYVVWYRTGSEIQQKCIASISKRKVETESRKSKRKVETESQSPPRRKILFIPLQDASHVRLFLSTGFSPSWGTYPGRSGDYEVYNKVF